MQLETTEMRKLIVAVVMCLSAQMCFATGLFPHKNKNNNSGSQSAAPEMSVVSPTPEPETYVLLLVGIGAIAWAVRNRKK
jgi:PEP-CTERM motif